MKLEQLHKQLKKIMEDKFSNEYKHFGVSIEVKILTKKEVRIHCWAWNFVIDTPSDPDFHVIKGNLQAAVTKILAKIYEVDNKIETEEEIKFPKNLHKKIQQNEKIKNNPELPGNGGRYCQVLKQSI